MTRTDTTPLLRASVLMICIACLLYTCRRRVRVARAGAARLLVRSRRDLSLDIVVTTTDHRHNDVIYLVTEAIASFRPGLAKRCRVFVYYKGDGGGYSDAKNSERVLLDSQPSIASVAVLSLANVGREQHTCFHHIATRYHDLADVVVFIPANATRRARIRFVKTLRRDTSTQVITRRTLLSNFAGYTQPSYMGRKLERAEPRGLMNWARAHVGAWDASVPSSHEGAVKTSRDRILRRGRSFYNRVARELAVQEPEAGHYTERLAMMLF